MRETGWGGALSPDIHALLADVDAAFALTGRDAPHWPDPYAVGPGPDEAAHERFSDPARFQIVVARAQAWITVLLDRSWARRSTHAGWAFSPLNPGGTKDVTVLEPSAAGAVKLVVVVHRPIEGDDSFAVTIAAGDPAVPLTLAPDCACDGCDGGSYSLLDDLDRWVLSVVDGSLAVDISTTQNSIRTSFGFGGGIVQRLLEPTSFRAAPWLAGWTSRPVQPEVTRQAGRNPLATPMIRRSVLLDFVRGLYRRLLRIPGRPTGEQIYRTR